ncbi:MAG: hypothetical protein M1817_005245 [Caeruleum heppii]|nr:MAG: hypothetical protein M1817_005245 [Caeruleum heppii]
MTSQTPRPSAKPSPSAFEIVIDVPATKKRSAEALCSDGQQLRRLKHRIGKKRQSNGGAASDWSSISPITRALEDSTLPASLSDSESTGRLETTKAADESSSEVTPSDHRNIRQNPFKAKIGSTWKTMHPFDRCLYRLQRGASDDEELPKTWNDCVDDLVEDSFFTHEDLRRWGSIAVLKRRYHEIRKVVDAMFSSNDTIIKDQTDTTMKKDMDEQVNTLNPANLEHSTLSSDETNELKSSSSLMPFDEPRPAASDVLAAVGKGQRDLMLPRVETSDPLELEVETMALSSQSSEQKHKVSFSPNGTESPPLDGSPITSVRESKRSLCHGQPGSKRKTTDKTNTDGDGSPFAPTVAEFTNQLLGRFGARSSQEQIAEKRGVVNTYNPTSMCLSPKASPYRVKKTDQREGIGQADRYSYMKSPLYREYDELPSDVMSSRTMTPVSTTPEIASIASMGHIMDDGNSEEDMEFPENWRNVFYLPEISPENLDDAPTDRSLSSST